MTTPEPNHANPDDPEAGDTTRRDAAAVVAVITFAGIGLAGAGAAMIADSVGVGLLISGLLLFLLGLIAGLDS